MIKTYFFFLLVQEWTDQVNKSKPDSDVKKYISIPYKKDHSLFNDSPVDI